MIPLRSPPHRVSASATGAWCARTIPCDGEPKARELCHSEASEEPAEEPAGRPKEQPREVPEPALQRLSCAASFSDSGAACYARTSSRCLLTSGTAVMNPASADRIRDVQSPRSRICSARLEQDVLLWACGIGWFDAEPRRNCHLRSEVNNFE